MREIQRALGIDPRDPGQGTIAGVLGAHSRAHLRRADAPYYQDEHGRWHATRPVLPQSFADGVRRFATERRPT